MSVRFVIGRAGVGKTHHCLASIREELKRSPLAGPRLVLLTPEQASLQMERALLAGDLHATHRAEVLSFKRLAYRVLQAAHAPERTALSPVARAMVLRSIIARRAPHLRYYKRVERLTGFFDRLGQTISELIEEDVQPDDLRAGDPQQDPRHAAKFADLADLYAAYLEHLGDTRLDPSQHLQLARAALGRTDYLAGARIWVDGFAGFTGQEMRLLVELARRAIDVDITLLVDPDYHARTQGPGGVGPADLFARPQRTYLALRQRLSDAGVAVSDALVLTPPTPPRFADQPALAHLEACFGRRRPAAAPAGDANADEGQVLLLTAPDRRVEVEYAVAQVLRLVWSTQGRMRYRDIAIICRDLAPYHDLLSAALRERNIPFFIDRRRSTAHHPLVELIRGVTALAATGWSIDAVRLLLKTGLLGLADDAADELENYVLAHGIIGRSAWEARPSNAAWTFLKGARDPAQPSAIEQAHLDRVNAARRRVLEVIGDFPTSAARLAGAEWARAFAALLQRANAAEVLEAWATQREGDGAMELAAEHRQIIGDIDAFLADLADALGDAPLGVADLAGVLEAGLGQLSMGLVPPTLDQVLVGSIERSRHPDIKAAIVLGFNDGVFPLRAAEDAILNDEDRAQLAGRNVPLREGQRQRILDEQLLAYVALTRPSEKLIVTCAAADDAGKALRPSPYAELLEHALPGLAMQAIGDPAALRATWPVLTGRDLAGALALEMSRRPVLDREPAPAVRQRWNDLYAVARVRDEHAGVLQAALASLRYVNEAQLAPASVKDLAEGDYTASVSELESFAACPFQRFARFTLRLRERREADLQPVDVGTVHHALLEEFLNDCLARNERFADVPDAQVLTRLEAARQRIGEGLQREGELSSARDAYILERSAHDLSPIVRGQQRVSSAGRFVPRAAERKYGFPDDPQSLPALDITTPQGRRLRVRGVIDRVDLAEVGDELIGVVVDYKRTRDKRLDLGSVYHGLSLQLLGYLLALGERGETLAGRPIVPVGAFYVSLLRKYQPVDHPDDAPEDVAGPDEALPRGLFDAGRIDLLEGGAPPTGRARYFKIFRKKDGTLGAVDTGDAAEPAQFAALLAHTRRKLGELADGVLDGDVSVSPYRLKNFSPCHWCPMKAICRFEFGDPGMRHLDDLKRSDVFTRVGEGDDAGD